MQHLYCFRGLIDPAKLVVVVDLELDLIRAIESVFTSASILICIWHINKNIEAKAKPHFTPIESFEEFF